MHAFENGSVEECAVVLVGVQFFEHALDEAPVNQEMSLLHSLPNVDLHFGELEAHATGKRLSHEASHELLLLHDLVRAHAFVLVLHLHGVVGQFEHLRAPQAQHKVSRYNALHFFNLVGA